MKRGHQINGSRGQESGIGPFRQDQFVHCQLLSLSYSSMNILIERTNRNHIDYWPLIKSYSLIYRNCITMFLLSITRPSHCRPLLIAHIVALFLLYRSIGPTDRSAGRDGARISANNGKSPPSAHTFVPRWINQNVAPSATTSAAEKNELYRYVFETLSV